MAEEPEAQAPPVQADPRVEAIAQSEQQLGRKMGAESAVEEPEAGAPESTGDPEPETPPKGEEPAEIDWSDSEARDAEITRQLDEQAERKEQETKDRLANQRRSVQGDLDLASQQRDREKTEMLLKELDELAENDTEAYTRRVQNEPAAQQALLERSTSVSPQLEQQIALRVVGQQAEQLFQVLPDLKAEAESGSELWAKVVNTETNGIFGYLQERFLEEGETAGVEKFKKSSEFKELLNTERKRAAHDAVGNGALGAPPPSEDDAGGASGEARQKFDDPAKQAVADALRQSPQPGFDVSRVRGPKRPAPTANR